MRPPSSTRSSTCSHCKRPSLPSQAKGKFVDGVAYPHHVDPTVGHVLQPGYERGNVLVLTRYAVISATRFPLVDPLSQEDNEGIDGGELRCVSAAGSARSVRSGSPPTTGESRSSQSKSVTDKEGAAGIPSHK